MQVVRSENALLHLAVRAGTDVVRRTIYFTAATLLLFTPLFGLLLNVQALAEAPSWLSGNDPTLSQLASPFSSLSQIPEPTVGSAYNIDCSKLSFKTNTTQWSQGCLSLTTYGALSGNTLLLNGTNTQASYTGTGSIDGIPSSSSAVRYMSASVGLNVYIYNRVYSEISTSSLGGGAIGFAFNGSADQKVKDVAGNLLPANPSSVAYSRNSQWMAYDSPNRAVLEINLQTMQVIPFMSSQTTTGAGNLPMAISDDGRYIAVSFGNPSALRVYDISTCSTNIPSTITGPVSCTYRDYTSYLSSHLSGFKWATQLRFDGSQYLDFYAQYNYVSGSNYSVAKERLIEPNVSPVVGGYLAMGDSFASGEGSYNYARGTDEASNNCHLSLNSYSYLMASQLNISNFHSVACSGAVTDNFYTVKQYAKPADNSLGDYIPGYQPQRDYLNSLTPGIITLSDGGNDIGFKQIILKCTLETDDCYSHYEDRYAIAQYINSQYGKWTQLYRDLLTRAPQGVKMYVTGYPSLISETGSCASNVMFTSSNDRQFANALVTYLNYVIQQAAASAGVQYVDIQNTLVGHRLCETSSANIAVNGYTVGDDAPLSCLGPIGSESFHPNIIGQRLLASAVLSATSDLTQSMPAPNSTIVAPKMTDTDTALSNFLNAPHDNLPISSYTVDTSSGGAGICPAVAYVQNTFTKTIQGIQAGLSPLTSYLVTLNSDPTTLGNFSTDANGTLNISVTIPSTVAPGLHQIHVTGTNMVGQQVDTQDIVYIAASNTDYDGDGIPNSSDTCPYTPNSGVDTNQDGIDDACEGYVDNPPLYRAVNGDPSQGQDSTKIYVERNETNAASLGITDYNPTNSQWVTVGATTATDDASSSVANFTITDTGINPPDPTQRYIPYLSTRTVDNGCVELTPASLEPVTSTSSTTMTVVATNTATCRSQPPTADVDSDGVPDYQDALYRARNGNASVGEDPNAVYIERNTTAGEAQLGLSDYSANASGWALAGLTNGATDGTYNSIGLIDPSTGNLLSTTGTITTNMWNTMTPAQLQTVMPVVLEQVNGVCTAIEPSYIGVVTNSSVNSVVSIPIPNGMACGN